MLNVLPFYTLSLFFFLQLGAMESPLKILLEQEKEITQTIEQAHELLDASRTMLQIYENFKSNYLKATTLISLIKCVRTTDIPELIDWEKKRAPVSALLASLGAHGLSLQKTFDNLDGEDSNATHSQSITSRMELTQNLITYNQEYQACKKNLKIVFGPELQKVNFLPFLTIKELKQALSQMRAEDSDEKLFFLCDYMTFLNNQAKNQIDFFNLIEKIDTILAMPFFRGTTPVSLATYPQANVLQFCMSLLPRLETKIINTLSEELKIFNNKNLAYNGPNQSILNELLIERKIFKGESKKIIDTLIKYQSFLSKKTILYAKNNFSKIEQQYDLILNRFKPASPNSSSYIRPVPVCDLTMMPHSAVAIQQLKTTHKQYIQFRLKYKMDETISNTETSVIYFFSKGSFITEALFLTSVFVFKTDEKIHGMEQDPNLKNKNEMLYYSYDGNYYFMNHTLDEEPRAYKVDYVAALCFPKQQSTPAKIQP